MILAEKYQSPERKHPVLLGSVTGQIGHTLGAAGMVSLIKAILELEHGRVPALAGLTTPIDQVVCEPMTLRVATQTETVYATSEDGKCIAGVATWDPKLAMACHVLLEGGSGLPQAPATSNIGCRIVRMGAGSTTELQRKLAQMKTADAREIESAGIDSFAREHVARVVVVADSTDALQRKLTFAAERMAIPEAQAALEQQGIFTLQPGQPRTRIAFLFPGQGSQYVAMLRDVVLRVPAAAAKRAQIDRTLGRLGYPSFAEIAWRDDGHLGVDVWRTQLSVLLADIIMHAAVTSMGLCGDVVCGHSYGEFPALVAAGALNLEQAILATRARTDAIQSSRGAQGCMLSTSASPTVIDQLAARVSEAVYVANHNSPEQTVVGGTVEGVAAIQRLLDAEGFATRILAVPRPYHTPLMAEAQLPFRLALEQIEIQTPQTSFFSSVTNSYVTSTDEIRENLVAQLTSPMRYVELIQRLAEDGVNLFIEVGPQQVLTRLSQCILTGKNVSIIASDQPKQPGRRQWLRLQGLLECRGVGNHAAPPTGKPSETQPLPEIRKPPSSMPSPDSMNREIQPEIILSFDATLRRKKKNRKSAAQDSGPSLNDTQQASFSRDPQGSANYALDARATGPVASSVSQEELESFMIDFIVDQTGYPPEMVELDADLEADLGIDSIKKAQLFGELAENFELQFLSGDIGDLSLDDFSTLRHMLEFMASSGSPPDPEVTSTPAAIASDASRAEPVVQPKVMPVSGEGGSVADTSAAGTSSVSREELESFMIDFIVDQTGYPPEMVELDADLEADLGIDSIKKAQLFGELAENFELQFLSGDIGDLSLDDFSTLRHMLDFMDQSGTNLIPDEQDVGETTVVSVSTSLSDSQPSGAASKIAEQPVQLNIVRCWGTPYRMGFQHGQQQAEEIQTILQRHGDWLGPRLQNIPELDQALANPLMYFGEQELEELAGIAAGMGLPVEPLIAHNLGMYPDYIPGCTQFAVTARRNTPVGMLHAANEDAPLALSLPDCLTRIVQVRHPEGGIPHLTFSVCGQLGGLIGINATGLAVTSTLLLDRPRRAGTAIGKIHPVIVKRILETADNLEAAVEVLRSVERTSAWSLCLSHYRSDRLCYLEYDGSKLEIQHAPQAISTTNHCSLQSPLSEVPAHSSYRLQRLQELLNLESGEAVTTELARSVLRDRFDFQRARETAHPTMNTIRRVDNQVSIVMQPALGNIWVTPGPKAQEHADCYVRLDVNELLTPEPASSPSRPASGPKVPETIAQESENIAGSPQRSAKPEPAAQEPAMERFVLRMAESPIPEGCLSPLLLNGPVVVLGQNATAEALGGHLAHLDAIVYELSVKDDIDETLAELDRIWQQAPVPHLFLMTGRDEDVITSTAEAAWSQRRKRGVLLPYLVCQRWVQLVLQAGIADEATLVAATSLGGDFGRSGRMAALDGGALTGLLKAVRREVNKLKVKVIDAPDQEPPAAVVEAICRELTFDSPQIEIGYVRGRRHVVRAVPLPASTVRRHEIHRGGTWVVTGGARGVTSVVARELGRRFGLKLHLLGRTPMPEIDPAWRDLSNAETKALKRSIMSRARQQGHDAAIAWRDQERAIEVDSTLRSLADVGVDATYHSVSVTDRQALAAVLEKIRRSAGPIEGIIHGAGVEAACRFERKQREHVEATFAVKVDGAAALIELTRDDPLRYFIGFGSSSGRFGGLGQTDYSMSSDMLCKLCSWLSAQRPQCAAVGIHWPPWAEVGMAVRPESKIALEAGNLTFMPPPEGVAHVIDELSIGAPEGEVFFDDNSHLMDQEQTMPDANLHEAYRRRDQRIAEAALIDSINELHEGQSLIAEATFDPTADPFLREHRHLGVPILPVVVGMEAMCESALMLADGQTVVGLRNVNVLSGLRFHTERPQRVNIQVTRTDSGANCKLMADFHNRQGRLVEPNRVHLTGAVELSDRPADVSVALPEGMPTQWDAVAYADDWKTMKFSQNKRIYHGRAFRGLQQISLAGDGAWARIFTPPIEDITGDRNSNGWLTPWTVLDACLLACAEFAYRTRGIAQLPQRLETVRFGRSPRQREACTLRLTLCNSIEKTLTFGFTLFGDDQSVILDVTGCSFVEVRTGGTASQISASTAVDHGSQGSDDQQVARVFVQAETSISQLVAQLPLIDSVRENQDGSGLIADLTLDPATDVFLDHHRLEGNPLLPSVIGMELLAEAAVLAAGDRTVVGLRDIEISTGFKFHDEQPQRAAVLVTSTCDSAQCELVGGTQNRRAYQKGVVDFSAAPLHLEAPPLETAPVPFYPMIYKDEQVLIHAEALQTLKELCFQRDGGWGHLVAKPVADLAPQRAGKRWFVAAVALDGCLVACGVFSYWMTGLRVELPHRFEQVKIGRQPNPDEKCTVRFFFRSQNERQTTYDFVLYGDDGGMIFDVTGYRSVLLTGRED